jgi:hypothetical protein
MQRQSHVDLGRRLGSSLYFGLIDWVPSIAYFTYQAALSESAAPNPQAS